MHRFAEPLERRQLLAAYGRFDDAKDTLRLFGTEGNDVVTITVMSDYPMIHVVPGTPPPDLGPPVTRFQVQFGDTTDIGFLYEAGSLRSLRIYLGGGDDTVTVVDHGFKRGLFNVPMVVDAGVGRDTIVTGSGNDRIDGGSSPDLIKAGEGVDTIRAGAGNDTIVTGTGPDQINGGDGNDEIRAGPGSDTINGGAGNDRIHTGGNDERGLGDGRGDIVHGGQGDDRIYSDDQGRAEISGDDGDDTLYDGRGMDRFDGGFGTNTVDYSARQENLLINIALPLLVHGGVVDNPGPNYDLFDDGRASAGETVRDLRFAEPVPAPGRSHPIEPARVKAYEAPSGDGMFGTGLRELDWFSSVSRVIGGQGNDVIRGTIGADTLRGGPGDDTIFAGAGQDDVYGDAGDDSLFTVDSRDGFPTVADGRTDATDLIDGGSGHDFARIDSRDFQNLRTSIERLETLRPLTS